MTTKITSHIINIDVCKGFVMLLLFSGSMFSQTITDVFPTRVTTGSVVTIKGTLFTTTQRNNIALMNASGDVITTTAHVLRNTGEMTFEIGSVADFDILDAVLTIGLGGTGPSAAKLISYIAPVEESLTTGESFYVKEIYTNWNYNSNGFWRSSDWTSANTAASPNDKHELLGYKIRPFGSAIDVIYSTGVDDALLEVKLGLTPGQAGYQKKVFKAYSTNGVRGTTSGLNFLMTGDMVDGIEALSETPGDFSTLTGIKALTILEVIIDGKNGLELGTAVGNFNNRTDVQFFSGNGIPGVIGDEDTPDLLITQMADPGLSDVYYYADEFGNVVGHPIKLTIKNVTPNTVLAKWKLNLFTFADGLDFASANPNGRATKYIADRFRPIRMVAFKLEDFGISTAEEITDIDNINMNSGGSADIAFMAYNQETFNIKGPVAKTILPQYVCRLGNGSSALFRVKIGTVAEGGNVGIEDFNVDGNIRAPIPADGLPMLFQYQLWKDGSAATTKGPTPSALTITDVDAGKLGVYKLRIDNGQGIVIVPVELAQGGTPFIWNGAWSSPYGDVADINIKERGLVFTSDYNEDVDLEGCDCLVVAGTNVTIPPSKKVKLYGAITIAPQIDEVPGTSPFIPAGTFTLKDNASLIQTKPLLLVGGLNVNENKGEIIVERVADNLKKFDYVYWSSPVEGFNVGGILSSRTYEWDVIASNTKGTVGNWVTPPSGIMTPGKGFIVRVPTPDPDAPPVDPEEGFTSTGIFEGIPNNGEYIIPVLLSPGIPIPDPNSGWNLIGNPYPSAINAGDFLTTNSTLLEVIDGGVYLWTHGTEIMPGGSNPFYQDFGYNYNSADYLVYNGTTSTDPDFDGNIASGQGFFVKAKAPENVRFTNAMRFTTDEEAYDNSQFFRSPSDSKNATASESEKQLLWLALTNEAKTATVAVVGYVQGATYGKDNLYDASHMGTNDFSLYTQVSADRLVIQGRPLPFDSSDKVTLGVAVPTNGIYSIAIDHLKGSIMLNPEQSIYLEDTYQNVIHDLKKSPYSFTAIAGDMNDRFVLRYMDRQLSVEEQQLSDTFVYVKNEQLHVRAAKNIESITGYDLAGKKVMDHHADGNSKSLSTPFQFPKGVYLMVITLENSATVTKKVLN
ncbi:hypothetical protein [Gelidibacter algens]|nr:hypothetical protein [Gelidibacter algens]